MLPAVAVVDDDPDWPSPADGPPLPEADLLITVEVGGGGNLGKLIKYHSMDTITNIFIVFKDEAMTRLGKERNGKA